MCVWSRMVVTVALDHDIRCLVARLRRMVVVLARTNRVHSIVDSIVVVSTSDRW